MSSPTATTPRPVTVCALPLQETARVAYYVEGTPAERIGMVWPLTLEVLELTGAFDAQSPLQRSVVEVRELGS